ncbi:MAG: 30S ribosomal protein S20 [Candidatus Jacksonbacteria bacterium]|nr:30S ribosomal protein S20 [Candidatus Jacksonbacteria bacterium]
MPVKKAAFKHLRQTHKKTAINSRVKNSVRTAIKMAKKKITENPTRDEAWVLVHQAIKRLDKAAQKKVITKNEAARKKSKLMKKMNALTAK